MVVFFRRCYAESVELLGAPFNERAISRRHSFAFLISLADDFIPGNGKIAVNDREIN
ncbi:hypothetical protein C7S17_0491 [Burkholderia thailandensis]|nr:hypothetical protein [Burkholderia thailandensis]